MNGDNELYHVLNRGVDKRDVFTEDGDYIRFIHDMYEFNDTAPAPNFITHARKAAKERDLLVRVHAFSLMRNHYHMLISEEREGGLSFFMRKLNMGYTKYFNEKYGRSGVLWQGTFRKKRIERDAHFLYIPHYIHLNPLDYSHPQWRNGTVTRPRDALAVLEHYRWSSHLDYIGVRNVPSVLDMSLLKDALSSRKHIERVITNIISEPNLAGGSEDIEI